MLKNRHFIFLFGIITLGVSTLVISEALAQEKVAITTNIDPITILTNEIIPLLDTSSIGNLTSISVTTNLPCDTSNVPKLKIIAGILGNTTNVIDSSSDYTNNKGPIDTCVFTDKITNVTAKGIPAMNRVFLKNTGSTPVHIPEGVMVTLTGMFEQPVVVPSDPCATATFCDDFSGSDNWVDNDSATLGVDTTNNYITGTISADNSNNAMIYDLGSGLASDTSWVFRFNVKYTNFALDTGVTHWIGLSSTVQTSGSTSTQDFIGVNINPNSNTYNAYDTDGAALNSVAADSSQSLTYVSGTTYYFEIDRISATTYGIKRYTDSTYATVTDSITGTAASTTQTLRYLKVTNHDYAGGLPGSVTITLDDVKFWNGVSSPP